MSLTQTKNQRIQEQATKILELTREIEFVERQHQADLDNAERERELAVKEAILEEKEKGRDKFISLGLEAERLKGEVAEANARIDELRKRNADKPYQKLEKILQAIVVKLPTLNISDLNINTKEK